MSELCRNFAKKCQLPHAAPRGLRAAGVFGMKTAFGGGRSTGFALMYDNLVQAYVEQLRLAKLANLQNFAKQASTTAVSRGGAKLVFMEGCI